MNTLRIGNTVWAVAMVALFSGCASKVKLDDKPPVESRTGTTVGPGGAGAAGAGASNVANVDLGKSAAGTTLPRIIYFDFDSYLVRDEFRPIIDSHAKTLTADRKKKVTIEGHTDERGGREYNLALGQKRSEAVLKSLILMGATDGQLEAVSYGKERPAVQGGDEGAWAKNRRAELNYK